MEKLRGRAWCYGDNVDIEHVLPSRYLKSTPEEASHHVMEGIDPTFAGNVRPGDIIVAGRNFGSGSTREQAALALKMAGVAAIIAVSFGRIFFRNAINLGLPVIECAETGEIQTGDDLEVDVPNGTVADLTRKTIHIATAIEGHILAMLRAGGLVPFLQEQIDSGSLKPAPPPVR